ncbi:MAG: prepilin-type N-terminal cleavage/methylation domain-containing protein [bacterium]
MKMGKSCHRVIKKCGFSLIEVMVVIAIIGILGGMATFSYRKFIDETRLRTATDIVASNLRQARQLAIATRTPHRVVSDNYIPVGAGQQTHYIRNDLWIEKRESGAWIQVSDPKSIPLGVCIVSFGGRDPRGEPYEFAGKRVCDYAEFNFRGQLTGFYCSVDRSPIAASLYIHLCRLPPYTMYLVNFPLEEHRSEVHSIEVLRLTGRVRTYDYGYGDPFPFTECEG